MSRDQHRRRAALAVLCAGCTVVFIALAWTFVRQPFHDVGLLMGSWWASGIAALALGVAACRVEEDSTDNARYLVSIVHGLRDEWRRS
ncbi:MAG: hypothetical protein ACRDO8_08320 [Nocardioidaceae bacterium]